MRATNAIYGLCALALGVVAPVFVASSAPVGQGKEWRELDETTGLSWSDVAAVCPVDGATPCSGSVGSIELTGWVWATSSQVINLMNDYEPSLSDANPIATGPAAFSPAVGFLSVMRYTTFTSFTYFYSESTTGWTASKSGGVPLSGVASYSHRLAGSTVEGVIGVGSDNGAASSTRGVFLWRSTDGDKTAPAVTSSLSAADGDNGWYRTAAANLEWNVAEPESPTSLVTTGCESVSVAGGDASTTVTCLASSEGGQTTSSVIIKRDATPPTLACLAANFTLGQPDALVTADVSDSVSGPVSPTVGQPADTSTVGTFSVTLTGSDQAGNTASLACEYAVTDEVVFGGSTPPPPPSTTTTTTMPESSTTTMPASTTTTTMPATTTTTMPATKPTPVAATAVPMCGGKVATIVGTHGDDVIEGTNGDDVIVGLGGKDELIGRGGNDILCGDDGNDSLRGGSGNDDLNGGSGSDRLRGDTGTNRCTAGEKSSGCSITY